MFPIPEKFLIVKMDYSTLSEIYENSTGKSQRN